MKVFVSHCWKSGPEEEHLGELQDRLKDAGFEVLLDFDIRKGDDWFVELDDWLQECDTAVLFIPPCPEGRIRDWMVKEASVLSHRWARERRLHGRDGALTLLVVLTDEIPPETLKNPPYSATGIERANSLRVDTFGDDGWIEAVATELRCRKTGSIEVQDRLLGDWIFRVSTALSRIEADMNGVLRRVSYDLVRYEGDAGAIPERCAFHLLHSDGQAIFDFIRSVRRLNPAEELYDALRKELHPLWVPIGLAVELNVTAEEGATVLLRADRQSTVSDCLGRASCLDPTLKPIQAMQFVDGRVDSLIADIDEEIVQRFDSHSLADWLEDPGWQEHEPDFLRKTARQLSSEHAPSITVSMGQLLPDVVESLSEAYPGAQIVVYGKASWSPSAADNICRLSPFDEQSDYYQTKREEARRQGWIPQY
ncbi:MAG: toll/interleukin-1 receptor domain-containing protein [Planctomycetota bacterium]